MDSLNYVELLKVLTQISTSWKVSRQVFIIRSKYFAVWFVHSKPPVRWYSKLETRLGLLVFLIPSINLVSTLDAWLFIYIHVSTKQNGYSKSKNQNFWLKPKTRICKKIFLDECYPLFVECLQEITSVNILKPCQNFKKADKEVSFIKTVTKNLSLINAIFGMNNIIIIECSFHLMQWIMYLSVQILHVHHNKAIFTLRLNK